MGEADLDGARRLQRQERWNQNEADWRLFMEANPDGCFVADARGTVVGTITSLRHGTSLCWLSMLLVDRDWRGQGIGSRLMRRVIQANQDVCVCLRLDATAAGRVVYSRLGFRDEYGLERWIAETPPQRAGEAASCEPLTAQDLATVLEGDRALFGADRETLLRHLRDEAPHIAWCIRRAGRVGGYLFGREGDRYRQIGPLVASHAEDAQALVSAGCLDVERPVIVDVMTAQKGFRGWIGDHGFTLQRELTRMSLGTSPVEQPAGITAIAGFEYG